MSSSEGPRGGDRAIARLRWLLVSAQDDESARREVLPALSRCTVLVPTIAGAADKLRFLPHPEGGSSLTVFTGLDALEHAAKKHGWAQGTQSVSFRAMSARDALETAMMKSLRSVIVDAAAEHALELKDEDVSLYLSRGTGEFMPESLPPSSRGTGDYGAPRKSAAPARESGEHKDARKSAVPARGAGDFAARGTGERNVAEVREEVAPRRARDARRDDDAGEAPKRQASAGAQTSARAQTQPTPRRRQSSGAARRMATITEIDDPFVSSVPRKVRSKPPSAGGQARRVPSLAAPPLSNDMPSSPFETSRPPSGPADDPNAASTEQRDFSRSRDATIPLEDISTAAAARASAERAASMPAPQRVSAPEPMSLPTADLPMAGFSDAPPPEPEPKAVAHEPPEPPPVEVAPAPISAAEPAVVAAPPPISIAEPAPEVAAPVAKVEPAFEREPRGTGTVPKPATLPPPKLEAPSTAAADELSEAVLGAIADELRKFPEVEWACQLDVVEDRHVIGIRVDPSYLARVKDIEASAVGAARKAGGFIRPLVVSTPAATKDARTRGRMFFPWKKKK